jgi:transcription initiation factor TFIIE subunit beta
MTSPTPSSLSASAMQRIPSTTSNGGGTKRKREDSLSAPVSILKVASSPHKFLKTSTNSLPRLVDNDIVTHLSETEKYLKEKGTPKTFEEIINFLSIQYASPESLENLRRSLESRVSKFNVHPPNEETPDKTYTYKPLIPVRNEEELRAYFQRQTSFIGVTLTTLKDGWPNCDTALDKMEEAHELMTMRGSRNIIKVVWQDDPTLRTDIPATLKRGWEGIQLPANADELRTKLQKAGLKPTSAPRENPKITTARQQKRKAPRKGGKQTNTHILHLLKDFPDLKGRK